MNVNSRADKLIKLLLGEEIEDQSPADEYYAREWSTQQRRDLVQNATGVKAKVFKAMDPKTSPEEREQLLADPELASVAGKIRARFGGVSRRATPATSEAAPDEGV